MTHDPAIEAAALTGAAMGAGVGTFLRILGEIAQHYEGPEVDRLVQALHDGADQIVAEVYLAMEAAQWRPIAEAPTNTSIQIYLPLFEHYGPGIYRAILVDVGTGRRWHVTTVAMGSDLHHTDWPKWWRPLPSPPA